MIVCVVVNLVTAEAMYDLKTNEAVAKLAKKDSSGAIPMASMCTGSGLCALVMKRCLMSSAIAF